MNSRFNKKFKANFHYFKNKKYLWYGKKNAFDIEAILTRVYKFKNIQINLIQIKYIF